MKDPAWIAVTITILMLLLILMKNNTFRPATFGVCVIIMVVVVPKFNGYVWLTSITAVCCR
jgi:hypothetical protein